MDVSNLIASSASSLRPSTSTTSNIIVSIKSSPPPEIEDAIPSAYPSPPIRPGSLVPLQRMAEIPQPSSTPHPQQQLANAAPSFPTAPSPEPRAAGQHPFSPSASPPTQWLYPTSALVMPPQPSPQPGPGVDSSLPRRGRIPKRNLLTVSHRENPYPTSAPIRPLTITSLTTSSNSSSQASTDSFPALPTAIATFDSRDAGGPSSTTFSVNVHHQQTHFPTSHLNARSPRFKPYLSVAGGVAEPSASTGLARRRKEGREGRSDVQAPGVKAETESATPPSSLTPEMGALAEPASAGGDPFISASPQSISIETLTAPSSPQPQAGPQSRWTSSRPPKIKLPSFSQLAAIASTSYSPQPTSSRPFTPSTAPLPTAAPTPSNPAFSYPPSSARPSPAASDFSIASLLTPVTAHTPSSQRSAMLPPLAPRMQSSPAPPVRVARTFPCLYPGCGMVFTRRQNMLCHATLHSGVRPHACSVGACGARFRRRQDLYRHVRCVHEGETNVGSAGAEERKG
ncbi:hypothetical protein HDU67_006296 [Dinochytrium kinnereticum]|nr:hypothetical protein HDU67_006296 [Dinochytrium kinnereticum]